jgi:hypothetical protein
MVTLIVAKKDDKMKSILFGAIMILLVAICASCSRYGISNRMYPEMVFSNIKSDYAITDLNTYGCTKIDRIVLQRILQYGTWITEKEVHDDYSTTGCTIKGSVAINNKEREFVYDYGGILYFADGKILGCGEACCREDYPNCSYGKRYLIGY